MFILTIRTDKPQAKLNLYKDARLLTCQDWLADRKLAETIHNRLKELLDSQQISLSDIQGIVIYKGPGSFTGLRIGISVANALALGLSIPIVGESGDKWETKGLRRLASNGNDQVVLPEYGAAPHVTVPKTI